MTLAMMLMTMLSFIFMWLKHPITMGITIIAQTLVVSMITGLMMGSFWFSYIITMTMLSGMLVLFIYMASVASNEKFQMSIKLITFSFTVVMVGIYMQLYSENNDYEMMNMQPVVPMENLTLNTLFNCKFKYITMMMVMYLMLTMVTVSFIVNISEGPLRISKK
uniref:NADH dehydrogenase subunit 6 n=1 Tax=Homoeocerus striicornis TaxID=2795333 RepID=UPI002A822D90|nr:NADH dehydrogenase subunit 6 [Homoeocerus striicornis]WOZ13988.1 NADH dehydrogenase subunit 6 [Homoeocerus striicornis]